MNSIPILHHFLSSHFNEKARWGLDWKRLPHRRVSHLPGPHMGRIKALTGQTAVPVLEIDGDVIAGSARILERLDQRVPERALHPEDPALRGRALAIQAEFDEKVGPAVRTAIFSVMIEEPDFLCRVFSRDRGGFKRAAYRAAFPVARPLMSKANGIDSTESIDRAFALVRQALDRVAQDLGSGGQLVGDAFSVADLACAALLAPLAALPHPDMQRPEPVPERVQAFVARWAGHETIAWVRDQYDRHRPPSAAIA
jgi:glutathione S-transferase